MQKIKTIFLVFLMSFFCQFILAQEKDVNKLSKNSISINCSDPLLKLLTKNRLDTSAQTFSAPTICLSRRHKKIITRIGLGGSNINSTSSSELFSDKKTQSMYKFRGTTSFYKEKKISEKINVQYGLNVTGLIYFNNQQFDSGFDKVKIYNQSWGGGVGPGVLFQYQLNKHFSVYTEYMLMYQYIQSTSGKKFSAFPEENYSTEKIHQVGFQFDYPIAIFLNYNF